MTTSVYFENLMGEHIEITKRTMFAIYSLVITSPDANPWIQTIRLRQLLDEVQNFWKNAEQWNRILEYDKYHWFNSHDVKPSNITLEVKLEGIQITSSSNCKPSIFAEHIVATGNLFIALIMRNDEFVNKHIVQLMENKNRVVRFWSNQGADKKMVDKWWTKHVECTGKYGKASVEGEFDLFDEIYRNCYKAGRNFGRKLDGCY